MGPRADETGMAGFEIGRRVSEAALMAPSLPPSIWTSASIARSIPISSAASRWNMVTSLTRRIAIVLPRSTSRSTKDSKLWKPFAPYSLRAWMSLRMRPMSKKVRGSVFLSARSFSRQLWSSPICALISSTATGVRIVARALPGGGGSAARLRASAACLAAWRAAHGAAPRRPSARFGRSSSAAASLDFLPFLPSEAPAGFAAANDCFVGFSVAFPFCGAAFAFLLAITLSAGPNEVPEI